MSKQGTASITDFNGTTSFVFWLSSPGKAQWMESVSSAMISGTARSQQGGPFGASTLRGNYAFTVAGISGYIAVAGVGALAANGSGTLAGVQDFNSHWTVTANAPLTDAYSIASNGMGAAALSDSGALPLHVLMVTPSEGVLVSIDPTQPVVGMTEQQCSDCH